MQILELPYVLVRKSWLNRLKFWRLVIPAGMLEVSQLVAPQ